MKIKNIGNINFDDENFVRPGFKNEEKSLNKYTPDNVWHLRSDRATTPTDFRQKVLSDIWEQDFIDKCEKVLEIGFGCGRNAQFFMNETKHIKFYGFDASPVGLKYFKAQQFSEDRYYVSLDIDEEILSQKYDLIFSTYVLQHIGFLDDIDFYDANRITQVLWPTLKNGGYWMCHEGNSGDNRWSPSVWLSNLNIVKYNFKLLYNEVCGLVGSAGGDHNLIVLRKS
ncbi:class I SAM-dependent methyltransferase [Candidatus Pacearchaeota archaeon]|nr:class I SAM-dependent methyltransferase [Candidatus Pacearchaeota archaeon]